MPTSSALSVSAPVSRAGWREWTARLGALVVTAALAACGGGSSSNGGTDAPTTGTKSDAQFLKEYMTDWYLWYTRLPAAIDASQYTSAQALLDAVRVKEDWYSYIDSAATFNAFFDEGQALGFGFGYSLINGVMWIRYVQPLANAATAGLQRGDQVLAIGGQTIAQLLAGGGVDAALGPAVAGTTASMTVLRNGAQLTIAMTKGTYAVRSIIDERVLTTPAGKVGYLVFTSFTNPADAEWSAALGRLLAQGVSDVIVDLRENGGGRLAVAANVASSLAPSGNAGKVEAALQFNDRHTGSNQTYYFQDTSATGKVQRLVWITSPRTCSASESVMVALRPLRSSWAVGETTCGKPVGFSPPEYNGKVYNLVTFKLANSAGFSDYYTGLTADCAVVEDYSKPFGDPQEPKLSAALRWLADGSCPSAGASAKSAAIGPPAPPTGYGIEKLTGLR